MQSKAKEPVAVLADVTPLLDLLTGGPFVDNVPNDILDQISDYEGTILKAASRRISTHPREVASVSQTGDNCLMVAIQTTTRTRREIPDHIIRQMVEACPRACSYANPMTRVSPLHMAVSTGLDPDIIRLIVRACPKAAAWTCRVSGGCTPLHSVKNLATAKTIVEACPRAVYILNNADYLPLHRAAYATNVGVDVLQYLIEEGKKCNWGWGKGTRDVLQESTNGITPLRAAIDVIDKGVELQEFLLGNMAVSEGKKGAGQSSSDKSKSLSPSAKRKWEKLLILASETIEAKGRSFGETKMPLLHTLVELDCPESIIRYALAVYSNQCQDRDRHGRSVLHLALLNKKANENIVRMLLKPPFGHPGMVRMLDRKGNLPLHILIGSGCGYSDNRMKMIIDIEPKALETRNGVYGLYPFMLAASCETNCDLDTVYELLRQTPHLVARCWDRASQEVMSNKQKRYVIIITLMMILAAVTGFIMISVSDLRWEILSSWNFRRAASLDSGEL